MAAHEIECSKLSPRKWRKPEPNWQKMPWHFRVRTVHTETIDEDFAEENRRFQKKRQQYMQQLQNWKVYYYGSPEEQTISKEKTRRELKRQIKELEEINSFTCYAKQDDSLKATEEERKHQQEEQKLLDEQTRILHTFRDDNKTIMEMQAEQRKASRKANWKHEQELLRHNPINWSCTLK